MTPSGTSKPGTESGLPAVGNPYAITGFFMIVCQQLPVVSWRSSAERLSSANCSRKRVLSVLLPGFSRTSRVGTVYEILSYVIDSLITVPIHAKISTISTSV